MFASWGATAHRHRLPVLVVVVLAVVAGGIWGLGVFDRLGQGGYDDPGSEAAQAKSLADSATGGQSSDVVVLYSAPPGGTVDDAGMRSQVNSALDALPRDAVQSTNSYWRTPIPQLATPDKRIGLATVSLTGSDPTAKLKSYQDISQQLRIPGTQAQLAGEMPMQAAMQERSTSDLSRAEAVSLPVVLVLLVLIFGGVVAASLPVLVGGLAVFGSLGLLHMISLFTSVNVFAVNVASLLGLGLAIDYGLFIVGRFREELGNGHPTGEAVWRSVASAGRTVAFSSSLLVIALAGLMLFPQDFLRSLAYGGMSSVALAAVISLTLLPALLSILGHRVDKLAMPWRKRAGRRDRAATTPRSTDGPEAAALHAAAARRRSAAQRAGARRDVPVDGMTGPIEMEPSGSDPGEDRPGATPRPVERRGMWHRVADAVMRRPLLVALPIVVGLVLLGSPFLGVKFGTPDERMLPRQDPARQAVESLQTEFPGMSDNAMQVVLRSDGQPPSPDELRDFSARVSDVPGVGQVRPAGSADGVTVLSASLEGDTFGAQSKQAVHEIRGLDPPAGAQVLVGGQTALNVDSLQATSERLPWMAALLIGATLVLMFLAFGSVLLPIKAVVMSALSLSATFGVLTWVFVDGHGAGFLGVTPAPLESGIVVLMASVVFGLSTDYEVFLLSRMVEAHANGADTREAVRTGLVRTARMITAAAVLLIVVTGAFASSGIAMMRFIGVGMVLALALDATVVRVLLVPAVLRLLGRASWWAPGPLRRLQRRARIDEPESTESDGEKTRPLTPVG